MKNANMKRRIYSLKAMPSPVHCVKQDMPANKSRHLFYHFVNKLFSTSIGSTLFCKALIVIIFNLFVANKVLADYTILSGNTVDAGSILPAQQTGTLYIYGTLTVSSDVFLSGFTGVVINGPSGQIFWSANKTLEFSAGIAFNINNPTQGLQPTGGNAAMMLTIGVTKMAVSNNNSNKAVFSFTELNAAGGLPNFTITSSTFSPATICYGTLFTATLTPSNNAFSFDCKWVIDNGGSITPTNVLNFNSSTTATITPTNSLTVKTYIITCTTFRAGDVNPITSKTVTVTVNPVTYITTQPSVPAATCSGSGTQTISVSAFGTGLTYTWRKGGIAVVNGGVISGQGTAILTLTNPITSDAGNYDVVISSTCTPVTSNSVAVTVNATSVTTQPTAPAATCSGSGTQTISVGASGTGLSYSWRKGGTAVVNGGVISGQGTATLTLTNPIAVNAGSYDVIVSGTCTPAVTSSAVTVTINTAPSITSQPTAPAVTCSGNGTQTIIVVASGTGLSYSWRKGGTTVVNGGVIGGQGTSTLTLTNPVSADIGNYDVIVSGTCTPTATSNSISVNVTATGTWLGFTNDWNNSSNWCGGIPASVTDVIIPLVGSGLFYPAVSSAIANAGNISIAPGASVTVNNYTLQISGNIANAGVFDVRTGSLVFNGLSTQTISGDLFLNGTLKNLKISNLAGLNVSASPAKSLNISGDLAFGAVNGTRINTGDNIILTSTATSTARVADITNNQNNPGNHIDGKVTVQRYYPNANPQTHRSWRLVTAPVKDAGIIFDQWQLSGAAYDPTPVTGNAGRGTLITGPVTSTNGLDYTPTNNYSLRKIVNMAYINIANTKVPLSPTVGDLIDDQADNAAYFLFVRGDRNPILTNGYSNNATILNSKGLLQTGTQKITINNDFELVGNPYASPVDFNLINKSNNINPNRFYVYDPNINQVGAFVTMEDYNTPGSFTPSTPYGFSPQRNDILSGQAFLVFKAIPGVPASLTFEENDKSPTNNLAMFRPVNPTGVTASLRATLKLLNNDKTSTLADGALIEFNDSYSESVDMYDAFKFTNINETFLILRNNKILSVERRPLVKNNDTVFLQLTKTSQRGYRFEFIPNNFDANLTAFLDDSFSGKQTPLSMTAASNYDFAITADAKSAVPNRFRIVFKQLAAGSLPVTFTGVKAYRQSDKTVVEWKVENEINISRYEVEKSADGINFIKVNNTNAIGTGGGSITYNWLDANALTGNNFYRIRSIGIDGSFEYSGIVVVKIGDLPSGIKIYPNPVTNGIIGAEFKNMRLGIYKVKLLNSAGQTVFNKTVNHTIGNAVHNIQPDYKMSSGIYQIEVTSPGKQINRIKVIVE